MKHYGRYLPCEYKNTHPRQNTVKRIREQFRARRQLAQATLAFDMFPVVRVELAQELDAVHEARHARRDVVVAVETDSTICNCFRAEGEGESSVTSQG